MDAERDFMDAEREFMDAERDFMDAPAEWVDAPAAMAWSRTRSATAPTATHALDLARW